jgi:hypothetical protein
MGSIPCESVSAATEDRMTPGTRCGIRIVKFLFKSECAVDGTLEATSECWITKVTATLRPDIPLGRRIAEHLGVATLIRFRHHRLSEKLSWITGGDTLRTGRENHGFVSLWSYPQPGASPPRPGVVTVLQTLRMRHPRQLHEGTFTQTCLRQIHGDEEK